MQKVCKGRRENIRCQIHDSTSLLSRKAEKVHKVKLDACESKCTLGTINAGARLEKGKWIQWHVQE